MTRCLIGLGSNLGASPPLFDEALFALTAAGASDGRLSSIRPSRPMGANAGGEFLNAAATLEWPGPASELLAALHGVEARFGRIRTVHWGPRTLDLDLLLFGDEVCQSTSLNLPHPAMWYRRFVLEPAAEIAGDWVHPTLQVTVQELLETLNRRPLAIAWLCHPELRFDVARNAVASLQREHPDVEWVPLLDGGELDPSLQSSLLEAACRIKQYFGIVELQPAHCPSLRPDMAKTPAARWIGIPGCRINDYEQHLRNLVCAILG